MSGRREHKGKRRLESSELFGQQKRPAGVVRHLLSAIQHSAREV